MGYDFSVVQVQGKTLAGVKVKTNMERAAQDCPAIWHAFGSRIHTELSGIVAGDSYGVSQSENPNDFTYWASIEVNPAAVLPSDLETLSIPEGLYVRCAVPGLAQIGDAYTALYMEWPKTQTQYVLDMEGICFEQYPAQMSGDGPFEIYAAVKKPG